MREEHLDRLPELHRGVVLAGVGNDSDDQEGFFVFLAGDLARIGVSDDHEHENEATKI